MAAGLPPAEEGEAAEDGLELVEVLGVKKNALRRCFGNGPFGRWLRAGTMPQNTFARVKVAADLPHNILTSFIRFEYCRRLLWCWLRAAACCGFSPGFGEVLLLEVRQGRLASDQVLDGFIFG